MGATLHQLFPNRAERPQAAWPPPPPFIAELCGVTQAVLGEALGRMFDGADETLFKLGESARSNLERRRCFDAMRVVRLDRARAQEAFAAAFAAGFLSAPAREETVAWHDDLEHLSIQSAEELESRIAATNLATRCEDRYANALWELECRLETAVREHGVPISQQALRPAHVCAAFAAAADALDAELPVKLLVHKLFDRVLIRELERVYAAALSFLERRGIAPAPRRIKVQQVGLQPAAPTPAPGAAAAASAAAEEPDLAALSSTPFTTIGAGAASTQRLTLAGRLLDEIMAEPMLPEALRPALEGLRPVLHRAALRDPGFFASPGHPLRRALTELAELAAASHLGTDICTELRDALRSASTLAGRGLAPELLAAAQPLAAAELERFLEQSRDSARQRRRALLQRVRAEAARELQLQTLGRAVPEGVLELLRAGIGPLLAVRLLRHGRDSTEFQQAQELLCAVLRGLEPVAAEAAPERAALLTTLSEMLSGIGVSPARIESLLDGLRQAYAQLDAPSPTGTPAVVKPAPEPDADESALLLATLDLRAAAPAPAAPAEDLPKVTAMELLSRMLLPETWFRIYDPDQKQTRWLALVSFYPKQDSVTFAGFDGIQRLALRATRFADDLVAGRSEPINPAPAAREALEQLCRARARGLLS